LKRAFRGARSAGATLATIGPLVAALCFAPPAARAELTAIVVAPPQPGACDSVTIRVEGTLPGSCHTLVDADISGPVPIPDALGPLPEYRFRIRVIVQEPNPLLEIPCTTELIPYAREFHVGSLALGVYHVNAVEYTVPWERPDAPRDTSALFASFPVTLDDVCIAPVACFLLDFRPPGGGIDRFCDAVGRPGGEGCFDVALASPIPAGGVQLEIHVTDLRASPVPSGTFTPKSVTTTARTEGFQVAWEADGSTVKAVLYSADGKTIPAGRGPILHVCYGISEDAPDGAVRLTFGPVVVADAGGNAILPCPTFAEETGWLCVGSRECDVNGDGASNILDIVRIVRCALNAPGSDACPDSIAARADCNGDGSVDVRDIICCVRRILASGGPDAPVGASPGAGTNFIGFSGSTRWISPADGRATIEVARDELCAGMQFRLAPTGAVRIRDVSIVEGGPGLAVEWAADPNGSVRAMLYASPTGAVSGGAPARTEPVRLEVALEPFGGDGAASGSLALLDAASASWSAEAAPTLVTVGTIDATAPGVSAPAVFPAAPNPFVSETEIAYALPSAARASLRIYDVRGRLVRVLVDGEVPAGIHRARWDGRDASGRSAAAGIYFVKLNAAGAGRTQRLLRLR
jgi:hypothetical protein